MAGEPRARAARSEASLWPALAWGAVALGAALRILDWFRAPSLWNDETFLAVNLVERPLSRLLAQPLEFHQVAPAGFLALERLLVVVAGGGELVLRALPAAGGLLALALFPWLAKRVVGARESALATLFVAASPALLGVPAQVKPYGLDLAAGVVLPLLWLAAADGRERRAPAVLFACVAPVLALASFATSLVLAGLVLATLAASDLRSALRRGRTLQAGALLTGLAGAATILDARGKIEPAVRVYLGRYWQAAFPRRLDGAGELLAWPVRWGTGLTNFALGDGDGRVAAVAAAAAVVALAVGLARGRTPAKAGAGILAVALAVTAAAAYPVRERLALFLLPWLALGLAAAIGALASAVSRGRETLAGLLGLGLLVPCLAGVRAWRPGRPFEDPRGVLEQVAPELRAGDRVYLLYAAAPAWRYYAPRLGLAAAGAETRRGGCHRGLLRPYLEEIAELAGAPRVWVVVSHSWVLPAERRAVERFLADAGLVRARFVSPDDPVHADDVAYLVDLSGDPARVAARAAALDLPADPRRGTCILFED